MNTTTPTSAVLEASRCITFNPLRSELMGYTKHCMNCGKTEAEHATETISGEFHVTDSGTEFVPKGRHTSGPWFVSGASIVTGGDECCIANIETDGGYEAPREEQTANAALIAKAWLIPELLEALEKCVELSASILDGSDMDKLDDWAEQARAVLAKATL